jgi:hypothetical protein
MADTSNEEARKRAIEKMQAARLESQKAEKKESKSPEPTPTSSAAPQESALTAEQDGHAVKHSDKVEEIDSGGVKAAKKRFLGVTGVDERMAKMDLTSLKNVKVYSPFRVYFDETAYSVSAENGTGPFDVLPGHKNFLSLLKPGILTVRNRRGTEEIEIERGVLHVFENQVTVFLDV